ncbi:hypothetical protein [Azospirillum sp. sgz302134]
MTAMAKMNDESVETERRRRLRGRNYAVLAALLALVVLFYVVTLVRMSGH